MGALAPEAGGIVQPLHIATQVAVADIHHADGK
jgi:hypothetical protein